MQKRYIILLVILIIIGGFFFWKSTKKSSPTSQTKVVKQLKPLPKETTITLDKNGFSPSTITIKTGATVRWINKSGDKQTVNSDNYPTNQLHKELNFGIFANNSSVTHIFTKPATYGYHNQLHPEQKGEIIVDK